MDNHPIPQDVTGFQFKLIGSMTVKQFAYLAGGLVIAWVFYVSPMFFIFKILFAIIFAGLGASLAFVPVLGRPLDVTIGNFFKAVFRPTTYVYQQPENNLSDVEVRRINDFNRKRQTISEMSDEQLREFLNSLPRAKNKLDQKEMVFFQNLNRYQSAPAEQPSQSLPSYVPKHVYANEAAASPQTLPPIPPDGAQPKVVKPAAPVQPAPIGTNQQSMQKPAQTLQQAVSSLEKKLTAVKAEEVKDAVSPKEYLADHQRALELQQRITDMLLQEKQLQEQLVSLRKQMETQQHNATVYAPSVAKPQAKPQPQPTQLVRSIPQNMTRSVGLVQTPEFPNVIAGIIKDPRGNPLSNILVEVKDSQGNAVRAFKTNALGQFISATALANGDYTIEFEDPKGQNKFVAVAFRASGEIILPIEVISLDTREELRRSLFN